MDTVESLFERFEQLNEVGSALSRERNIQRLLESILVAAKTITRADGGTLYLLTPDKKHLRFAIVRTQSLGISLGGTTGQPITDKFPDLPLCHADGAPNNNLVAAYAANTGQTVNIPDAYAAEGFDFTGTRRFDQSTGYRSRSFLTVPLQNHEADLIGVLQLLNCTDPVTGQVCAFSPAEQRLAESLASQAAVAVTNRQLLQQLEKLFESFIRLINGAIDEKSPYTGGHCERVPELTMMLAEAVNETTDGPLADVKFNEKDFYELRIAALLHDCGKITTPVHVVDKATKLETIFDRIHLVDTRFSVLRQQAETAMWRSVATGQQSQADAQEAFEAHCVQLQHERAFLRMANVGGERMRDEDIERVKAVASAHRYTDLDGASQPLLNDNEIYNLSIRAGTLTAEECEVINYHIVATIKMLEQLDWPKELRNVPEYAGGHHERMDGKGYPKGLKRDEMSWQARMMGITDIFEALTANDRPYKKAMTVSQSLKIMDNFKANGHIDPVLYEVFLSKQVYKRYAQRFLAQEQIDV